MRIGKFEEGSAEENRRAAEERGEPARDVRARYLDYCAARISEVFLALSDERTYALMEEAAREAGLEIGSLGFSDMMDLVTERLRTHIPLPTFEEFAVEYREHPERFDVPFDAAPDPAGDENR